MLISVSPWWYTWIESLQFVRPEFIWELTVLALGCSCAVRLSQMSSPPAAIPVSGSGSLNNSDRAAGNTMERDDSVVHSHQESFSEEEKPLFEEQRSFLNPKNRNKDTSDWQPGLQLLSHA